MPTYKEKVNSLITIRDYIVGLVRTVPGMGEVTTKNSDLNGPLDSPITAVLYKSPNPNAEVRERENSVVEYNVIFKTKQDSEDDVLPIIAGLMEKFEEYSLGGNCIGAIPHLPEIYYDDEGEPKTVYAVVVLDVEI